MTDEEAEVTLRRIDAQRSDPFVRFFDSAPVDDEPVTAEEAVAVAEADAERAAGAEDDPVRRRQAQVRLPRGRAYER